jgi:hypothetical protein
MVYFSDLYFPGDWVILCAFVSPIPTRILDNREIQDSEEIYHEVITSEQQSSKCL